MSKYNLTIKDICNYYNVSEKTIRRWIKTNKIDYKRIKTNSGYTYFFSIPEGGHLTSQMSSQEGGHDVQSSQISYLQNHISFLQKQIEEKDRQLEEKDRQIENYFNMLERITHQSEILSMITQGLSPKELLKGGQGGGHLSSQMSSQEGGHDVHPELNEKEILEEIKRLKKNNYTNRQIANELNEKGIKPLKKAKNDYWTLDMIKKIKNNN